MKLLYNFTLVKIGVNFFFKKIPKYIRKIKVFIDPQSNEFTCEENSDPCSIRACECDVELVNNLVLSAGDEGAQISSLTEYGGFDPATQCLTNPGGAGGKADKCCGDYPKESSKIAYPSVSRKI